MDVCYTLLTTFYLALDERALRRPPPGAWPAIPLEKTGRPDKDFVLDVARQLPYINTADYDDNSGSIDYKCRPLDYSPGYGRLEGLGHLRSVFGLNDTDEEGPEDVRSRDHSRSRPDSSASPKGNESGRISLYLDTMTGGLVVHHGRVDTQSERDMAEYFEDLKEKPRTLTYVPIPGE